MKDVRDYLTELDETIDTALLFKEAIQSEGHLPLTTLVQAYELSERLSILHKNVEESFSKYALDINSEEEWDIIIAECDLEQIETKKVFDDCLKLSQSLHEKITTEISSFSNEDDQRIKWASITLLAFMNTAPKELYDIATHLGGNQNLAGYNECVQESSSAKDAFQTTLSDITGTDDRAEENIDILLSKIKARFPNDHQTIINFMERSREHTKNDPANTVTKRLRSVESLTI